MRLIADKGTSDSITGYDASIRLLNIGITERGKGLACTDDAISFKLLIFPAALSLEQPWQPAILSFPQNLISPTRVPC